MAYTLDLERHECRKCYTLADVRLFSRENVDLGLYCSNCVKRALREQRQLEGEADLVTKPTK
jgi:hypothetical protein